MSAMSCCAGHQITGSSSARVIAILRAKDGGDPLVFFTGRCTALCGRLSSAVGPVRPDSRANAECPKLEKERGDV